MLNKEIEVGIKLWATNLHYVEEAKRLWKEGFFDYIELTAVSGSFNECAKAWKEIDAPYVIHGPTFAQGFSFADKSKFDSNMERFKEVQKYADYLNAPTIIMHPGIAGDIKESERQLIHLNEPRIAIENKPYYVKEGHTCNGYLPEEIKQLMTSCHVGCCFDIGHMICAANVLGKNYLEWMQEFLALKPTIFHMTDGNMSNVHDVHWHLGSGNFPIEEILSYYPDKFRITLETIHDYPDSLRDFEDDARYIYDLIGR